MVLQKIKKWLHWPGNHRKSTYKKRLLITQQNQILQISGEFARNYKAKEIWLVSYDEESRVKIAESAPSSKFSFKIDLADYQEKFAEGDYRFFMLIQVPKADLTEKQWNKVESRAEMIPGPDGEMILEYPIRLGKFQETEYRGFEQFHLGNRSGILFNTAKNFLSLAIDKEISLKPKMYTEKIQSMGNQFFISGSIYPRNFQIIDARIVLSGRESGVKVNLPMELSENQLPYGNRQYNYTSTLQLDTLLDGKPLDEDVYDFYLDLHFNDGVEDRFVRIGSPRRKAKKYSKPAFANGGDATYIVTPYFTFKYFNLSLQVDRFERDTLAYLKRMMTWAWLLRPFFKSRDIWLVGERPYKAQDTGFRFFQYMRTQHPERNVYYVIEKDSPELRNVKDLGNILYFRSKEHIWHCIMARRVIGSHHPDYLYPLRTERFKKIVKAKKVFLQHGVMGTKNMVRNYGVSAQSFDTDLFIVSSDYEKSYIVQDFGYDPKEVVVTGLSRFDSLLKNDVAVKRQLLIIPTWRDWITTDEKFLESEYFERYRELVFHPSLHEFATKYNFEVVFCLHPNMQRFTPYFKDAPVKIVSQGEIDVQYLLKESSMMITDYSSVAFDMSFLHKPIIYYQFDRNRFIGKFPSHLDLDNDLPGDIVDNIDEVLECVENYARNDFAMKPEYQKRAAKFLKYHDTNACKRIYEKILKIPNPPLVASILRSDYVKYGYRRFRKSRYYFPIMKVLYKIEKKVVPIDKNLILFESGLGKQYADSPRYIYEEILRRGLNYKKVWVYNKQRRFKDPKTKYVKRLSMKYYYYLARSGYWVNNQNFPTYIKKRPGTTYVQTWHGTPLKKMLFDIENVQGRTEDYVERVHGATKNWDYLISPSAYATRAFKSAFHYDGRILEIGYPRNDIFYRKEKTEVAKNVRAKLRLPKDKKVILYAPTFRDNQTNGANKFTFDINFDYEKMKEKLGRDYILLLRMHVVVKNKVVIPDEYRDFVYNVSNYPDIQELYLISDILITDYSSVMFDFANTKRPILFYTYDLELYRDVLRGFYLDFENEAPGPLIRTNDELIEAIERIDDIQKQYSDKYKAFHDKYCSLEDGHAAERLVDQVFAAKEVPKEKK